MGVLAGATSGLFGGGGGIIIVPGLLYLAKFPQKLATGTSLGAIVPISVAGIAGYATGGEVDWSAAAVIALGALAGAVLGTRWLVRVGGVLLHAMFAGAVFIAAVRMFTEVEEGAGRVEMGPAMASGLMALGLASGVLAGLLGVGGGIVIVPLLTLVFGVPHTLAKGTSLAVILPTAVMGTLRNRRSQLTALMPAAVVGLAGVGSAFAASRLALRLDPNLSRALFAGLLVTIGARLSHSAWAARREPA